MYLGFGLVEYEAPGSIFSISPQKPFSVEIFKNAEYFLKEGLCRVLPEKELTAEQLYKEIELLLEDKNLKTALSRCGIKRGNKAVINEIISALE